MKNMEILNKDGIEDLVLVVEGNDPSLILHDNDFPGEDSINHNPRVMAIYWGAADGSFTKAIQANEFIILKDNPNMDEPFDGISISKKGVLKISFKFWYSAGSWSASNHSYKFRYQENQFKLIAYDSSEVHRASGELNYHSINFLSRKMKISEGNISEDEPSSVKWQKFQLKELPTLQSLERPFTWSFEGLTL